MIKLPSSITEWKGSPIQAMVSSPGEAYGLAWAFSEHVGVARVLRGWKMRTVDQMFDEVGAALQFPYYFGENWPAFDECLNDLQWLPAPAYLIVIVSTEQLLSSAPEPDFGVFFKNLKRATEEWPNPGEFPGNEGRPSRPFHVLLQVAPDDATAIETIRKRGQIPLPIMDIGDFFE